MVTRTRQIEFPVRANSFRPDLESLPPSASRPRLFACGLALLLFIVPSCKPKATQILLGPSQALTAVLAEEAASFSGTKKQIALITHDASWGPPSTVEQALVHLLKKQGHAVAIVKAANIGNPMLSGAVGLKAADFFEALEKSAGSGALISLVGAPLLTPDDTARLTRDHTPVLVVATAQVGDKIGVRGDPLQLARLLESQAIQLAIIDGGSAANGSGKTNSERERFDQNYRILRRPQ